MATIASFKGIIYKKEKVEDIGRVITPPYDVISPDEQDRYYRKHENNVIKIILGKDMPSDNDKENKYTRASNNLSSWLSEGIMEEDKEPAVYIYEQTFELSGKVYTRTGIIALLKFEGEDSAKFHENTFAKPKEDRLALLKATNTNTEPIFGIYPGNLGLDPEGELVFETKDDGGMIHRLFKITDGKTIKLLKNAMKEKKIYIADGHHRFETAMNYAKEMGSDLKGSAPYNYVMMFFTSDKDPGLLVLPIHRAVNIANEDVDHIMKLAKKYFLIVEIDSVEKIHKAIGHVFGFYTKKDNKLYMLKLRDAAAKDKIMAEKGKSVLKDLDVSILHTLLLDDVLAKYKHEKSETVAYIHDDEAALAAVKTGKYNAAFILNPTKVSQIMQIADTGSRMPQKSTFFYPKLYSGVVMRKLE